MKVRISKRYSDKVVFENFALDVADGEILCILGASGVGKSTLLNIVAGLTTYEGKVEKESEKVGYIFQEDRLLPNLTVMQNLQYVGGRYEDICEILKKIELLEAINKYPSELSGGEKQRVSLARAFLFDAPVLLMDEPFSSLDIPLKIRLAEVFATLWEKSKPTVLFVTHDVEEAVMLGHRIVVIENGGIAFDAQLVNEKLPRKYGKESEEKDKLLKKLLK